MSDINQLSQGTEMRSKVTVVFTDDNIQQSADSAGCIAYIFIIQGLITNELLTLRTYIACIILLLVPSDHI